MSYQQVLALFNRTNIVHCLLACSVFGKALQRSFKPLFCMVSKLFWRKILLLQGQQKVNFSEGQPTLVMSHFFLVGGNKHNFRAYPTTLKIAELCFETKASHSTII